MGKKKSKKISDSAYLKLQEMITDGLDSVLESMNEVLKNYPYPEKKAAVSAAMDTTGAGALIADWTVGLMGGSPSPLVVTAILFILSCGLTQFMSNTASAALLCPIGIAIAKQLGADPKAVLMAIAVAASCDFATPVGTPPNTLVLGPGLPAPAL